MRIMELYRIENDFKNHKRRLQSIQQMDSKERVARITSQQFYMSNEHKKIKINSDIFKEKEEVSRRQHSNELMNRTITQRSKKLRQQYESSLIAANPHRTVKNVNEQLQLENLKLKEKIEKMQSVYRHTRKNSDLSMPNHATQRDKSRQSEKEKLLKLLKTQFKLQPVVSFPRQKTKPNANETLQDRVVGEKEE